MTKRIRMTVLIVIIAAAWTPAPAANGQNQKQTPVTDDLIAIELEWHKALEHADLGTLDRLLARDWFITNGSGFLIPRTELFEGLRKGEIRFVSTIPSQIAVHVYGDAAVVTKRSIDKTQYGESTGGGTYQMTDMFVRIDGRWQCVATHASRDLKPQ